MTWKVVIFYAAALFFSRLILIRCSSLLDQNDSNIEERTGSPHYAFSGDDGFVTSESIRLSLEIFPATIIDLLSPEMFSQLDPVLYFLEKAANLPLIRVRQGYKILREFLTHQRDKFPRRYLPYAEVLANLLNFQSQLEDVTQVIYNMGCFSNSFYARFYGCPTIPAGIIPPALSELFTSDVFKDDRPPLRLLIKLTNVPHDEIDDMLTQSGRFYVKNEFPYQYYAYAKELRVFFLRNMKFSDIKFSQFVTSVSELRDFFASESSDVDGLTSSHTDVNSDVPQ